MAVMGAAAVAGSMCDGCRGAVLLAVGWVALVVVLVLVIVGKSQNERRDKRNNKSKPDLHKVDPISRVRFSQGKIFRFKAPGVPLEIAN